MVIIPEGLDTYLDSEQFIDVLYHELIHVRRMDFLSSTVAEVFACLLFFHPAVWLALRNLGRERELACDMTVMDLRQGRRANYALCLTRLARRQILGFKFDPPSHLALLNSFLAFRVKTLLAENRDSSRVKQATAVFANFIVLSVFIGGWSYFTFAIRVARPLTIDAGVSTLDPHFVAAKATSAQRGRKGRSSTNLIMPTSAPPMLDGDRAQTAEPDLLPIALRESREASDFSSDATPVPTRVDTDNRSIWDDGSAPEPVPNTPSARQTVTSIAIDVLERLAQGRRGSGDTDDRASRPR